MRHCHALGAFNWLTGGGLFPRVIRPRLRSHFDLRYVSVYRIAAYQWKPGARDREIVVGFWLGASTLWTLGFVSRQLWIISVNSRVTCSSQIKSRSEFFGAKVLKLKKVTSIFFIWTMVCFSLVCRCEKKNFFLQTEKKLHKQVEVNLTFPVQGFLYRLVMLN